MHNLSSVTVEAQFDVTRYRNGQAKSALVLYRVRNQGSTPIGVLIPGSLQAPQPAFAMSADGDLTITLQMTAPRADTLAAPVTVYAARVAAGADYARQLPVTLLAAYPQDGSGGLIPPRRVRLCQGYAPFDERRLVAVDGASHWRAPPTILSEQMLACSAWSEL